MSDWLEHNSSERVKRSIMLELAALMHCDAIITGDESDFLSDVARRFKISNLKDYVDAGAIVNDMYIRVAPLFDGISEE